MRVATFAAVLPLVLLAGCVDAGIGVIEESRRENGFEPGEEEGGQVPTPATGPPTPATPTRPSTPPPTPATPPPVPSPARAWPVEGSVARYVAELDGARAYANWTYTDGAWAGTCERAGADPVAFTAKDPPHWPPLGTRDVPDIGDEVETWHLELCRLRASDAPYRGLANGSFLASEDDLAVRWDAATGLVLVWRAERGDDVATGQLTMTDAPLSAR